MPLQIIVVRNLIPQIDMMPLTMDSFASAPSVTNELSNKCSIATATLAKVYLHLTNNCHFT